MSLNIKLMNIGCVILLAALTGAGGFFIHHVFSDRYAQIQIEAKQKKNEADTLKRADTRLKKLQTLLDRRKQQLEKLDLKIPENPRIGEVLTKINASAKKRDISLSDFNHKLSTKFKQYRSIRIKITVNGNFVNIYRFIHDLETLNRIFVLEELAIEKKEDQVQALLSAKVFQQG